MPSYRSPEEIKEGFEVYDDRFRAMVPDGAKLDRHCTGMEWAEGPVYFADGDYVLWSDIPNDRVMRWSPADGCSVYLQPAGYHNGHYLDRQGRLLSCEHGRRRISRTEPDGTVVSLADRYQGKRLNSPNDLVVKSDGTIWFTDPPYGILSDHEGHQAESELGANYVFRLDPESGDLRIVTDELDRPNGICFSPDESLLYVADTGEPMDVRVFDVVDWGAAGEQPAFRGRQARRGGRLPRRHRRQPVHERLGRRPSVQSRRQSCSAGFSCRRTGRPTVCSAARTSHGSTSPPTSRSIRSSSTYGARRPRSAAHRQSRPPDPGNPRQRRPPGALSGAVAAGFKPAFALSDGGVVDIQSPDRFDAPPPPGPDRVERTGIAALPPERDGRRQPIKRLDTGDPAVRRGAGGFQTRRYGSPVDRPGWDTNAGRGAGRPATAPSPRGRSLRAGPSRRRSGRSRCRPCARWRRA